MVGVVVSPHLLIPRGVLKMTTSEQITKIKKGLGIAEGIPDETVEIWLTDVKDFMKNAGVPDHVINASTTIGLLARGVSDIWNYGDSEKTDFSVVFKQRVAQLSLGRRS